MNLAENFRQLRLSKEYSVYKLSKLSDVSENYIHKIEKGESLPSIFILEKLLSCLEMSLSEFFCENDQVMYPSAFEREVIEHLRMLNEEQAAAILHLIKLMKK